MDETLHKKPVALTIGGSDPSGGAGIQADLKVFHERGVYGMGVLTLLTVQNTRRIDKVRFLDAPFVAEQLDAVLEDIPPGAAKTGALGTQEIIEALSERAARFTFPLIVDPVFTSTTGTSLMNEDAVEALLRRLLPHAALVTPNLKEAEILSGIVPKDRERMMEAARRIADLGGCAVLIKGGHLQGEATDILFADGSFHSFPAKRIGTQPLHGAGCTLSAAITAELAKKKDLISAVRSSKRYVSRAIEARPDLGAGASPLDHHASFSGAYPL